MGSIIRLVSCLVSVATILLKCVQQLEWATVFLCCFLKLRSHCCHPYNFQGSTNTWPTKKKTGRNIHWWSAWILAPGVSSKHRSDQGAKPKVMLPRCLPDASQFPLCSPLICDVSKVPPARVQFGKKRLALFQVQKMTCKIVANSGQNQGFVDQFSGRIA